MNTPKKGSWLLASLMTLILATTARAQTTANWVGPATGGEWNTGANWDTGFPPLDVTTNAFIGTGSNVNYNLPMAAASFGDLTLNGVLNINAVGFTNNSITMVRPGGLNRLFVNNGGAVGVAGSLIISSNAAVLVAPGGSLTTSVLQFGNVNSAGSTSFLTNNGGNITATTTIINNNNASASSMLMIVGGTNNLGDVTINRAGPSSQPAIGTEGVVISNGVVNATSLTVGGTLANSFLTMFVGGGVVTNTGAFTVHLTSTAARPARYLQTGGTVVTVEPNVVTMNPQAAAGVLTIFSVTGGTNFTGGFQFGDVAAANIGTANFTNGANIYVGAEGILSNGAVTLNAALNNGGLFGATADWTGNASMLLNGGAFTFQAAAPDGTAHNISLSGALRGSGGLTKTGVGTLTLTATNTYSGITFIKNGTLALATDLSGSVGSLVSPTIVVGSGTTFDVSQAAPYSVNSSQTLGGSGTVSGAVAVAVGGIINPGSNLVTGTLTFNNNLTELAGAVNHFDVPGDAINVTGTFTVSGTNTMEIAGGLPSGSAYALVHYGTFSGDLTNFVVTGASGTLSNSVSDKTLYLVVASSLRSNTNLTWVGNSLANTWDTHGLTNWVDGGTGALDFFLAGDNTRFDNLGAVNFAVNIPGSVNPATVVVDSTSNYVFSGAGQISGPITSLTKTNSGTLTMSMTNSYAGPTTFGGGAVEVFSIANSSFPSPLGAAAADPAFLVFNGGALRYSGDGASTDRGATFNADGILDVTNPATSLTLNGTLTGTGGLTKIGNGTLIVASPNSYLGLTTVSGGTLQVNSTATALPVGVFFSGGTLSLNVSGQQIYSNPLTVATTGTLNSAGGNNNVIQGPWSGNGTLTVNIAAGGTFTINANMTPNFVGTIVVSDTSAGTFRFNAGGSAGGAQQSSGSPTASFDLGNSAVTMNNRNGGGLAFGIYSLGSLSGGPNTILRGNSNGGGVANTSYYSIGAKNLNTIFAGTIVDGAAPVGIIKAGTGTLTLQGQNTYTGSTTISNGVLALAFNPTNFADGTILNSSQINILAGATLDVSGRSDDTLLLNAIQTLAGYGTLHGLLDTTPGGTVAPGDGASGNTGTLTVTGTVNLGGTTWMKLNHSSAPNSDRLAATAINLSGTTLVVTNAGGALQVGDTFTLFNGPLSGSFGTIMLPNYYTWDTHLLAVNGTIQVTSVSLPTVKADFSTLSSGTITLTGANGLPNGTFTILSSTNVALPLTNWTAAATGSFDGLGGYSVPVTVNPAVRTEFFILSAQ